MKIYSITFILVAMLFTLIGCTEKDSILMIHKEINENWTFSHVGKNDWLPATVPGTVHTDLIANDKIEDPFYRMNEHNLQWIDKVEWEYKTTFTIDEILLQKNNIELDFKGLD